jgi:glycosyltransferase A (GT-A) superfamily protein (DUF2064 family)
MSGLIHVRSTRRLAVTILLRCDCPGCTNEVLADRVDALGRIHVRPPWVIYGGTRSIVVCQPSHAVAAAQSPVPPLAPAVDRRVRE